MSDMTDLRGWDEFSAYQWLNSKAGKESMGWPLDKHATIDDVRLYIAGSKNQTRIYPKQEEQPTAKEEAAEVPAYRISDLEYLMAPLQEFAERVLDLMRVGLETDDDE